MPETSQRAFLIGELNGLELDQIEDQEPVYYIKLTRIPLTDEWPLKTVSINLPSDVVRPAGEYFKLVVREKTKIALLFRCQRFLPNGSVLIVQGQLLPKFWSRPRMPVQGEPLYAISDDALEVSSITLLEQCPFTHADFMTTSLEALLWANTGEA